MVKHFLMVFIFGLLSLLSHGNSNVANVDFETFSIILSWLFLFLFIFSIKWFDKITDGYFVFTILFALAARLAKYNAESIADNTVVISMIVTSGLLVQCINKKQIGSGILVLSVLLIEWINLKIPIDVTVDLSGIFV